MALPEECALELGIGAREGAVVPVDAPARLTRAHEQRQEHAREQRFVVAGARAGMGAREDRRSRLALQLLYGELRVGPAAERVRTRFDEGLDERPVLVQRGLVVGGVLLERKRQLGAPFELREQRAERAQAEGPQGREQLRSAHHQRYASKDD